MRICKKLIQSIIIIAVAIPLAQAQIGSRMPKKDKIEGGIFIGASNYEGTLEEKIINYNFTQLGYGAMVRYNFSNKFALRFGMDQGTIEDADYAASSEWRIKRNLSFKTSILDGYLAPEFYFATVSTGYKTYAQFYIFGGLGTFHFNPQAYYQGAWVNLQPLGTEGQGTQEYPNRAPYQLNQIYIPFGTGVRFTLSKTWFLNIEFRANKTFTDYLDDVSLTYASPDVLMAQGGPLAVALADRTGEIYPGLTQPVGGQRGGAKPADDWFFFTGFTISHAFRAKSHCYSF